MRVPRTNPKTDYIKLGGGLDQISPALSVPPGAVLSSENYEAKRNGGYQRIDGYERYDGQSAPSDATYYWMTASGGVSVLDEVTGSTSGATGIVSRVHSDGFDVTKVSGTFEAEEYTVSGSIVGSISDVQLRGAVTHEDDAISLNAAADLYRSDIAAPTGSGAIRGIAILDGTVYCFRDNADGTAGLIYKETTSGWSAVTLHHEISFDSGTGLVEDGDDITQLGSEAAATVERVVLESGAWGTDAAGRLILSGITGTFDATHEIQVSEETQCTATSLATEITITPGGRYDIVEYNFYASTDTKRLYGCDGKNRGFEFDGDVYVPIDTGMPTDTPSHVYAYKLQLFFSFKGSVQNSGVGTPYEWTAVTGSLEIGLGDDVTGMMQLAGSALGIFSRNSTNQLLGNNADGFELSPVSDKSGCLPWTVQKIFNVFYLDDQGVSVAAPTDRYGNFTLGVISRRVQAFINEIRDSVVASSAYRARDQYRLYGDDGSGLSVTVMPDGGFAFMPFYYPDNVACAYTGKDSDNKDVVFFGSDEGMVYQADKGSSFDGEAIRSFLTLPFNHSRSPNVFKSYLSVTLDLSSVVYSNLKFSADFSYGDPDIASHITEDIPVKAGAGFWDVSNWDEFSFDSAFLTSPTLQISGAGKNMNLVIYSTSETDLGHQIDGVLVKYIPRRFEL
jgi:hypothetical protein